MESKYYYFSTHNTNQTIYDRLKANREYELMDEKDRELLNRLVEEYPIGKLNESPIDFITRFILKYNSEFRNLYSQKGNNLKFFLMQYLGYVHQWGASTKSFGKNSLKRAELISESDLIKDMTSLDGSIWKLLDSANYDLAAVKPFLPAIMISLHTNTRDRSQMDHIHTGRFCFDFDKFPDANSARYYMNKVWKGTKNLNPYMGFLSPRGKGFKLFYRVDTRDLEFKEDFKNLDESTVIKFHKLWYEGALMELIGSDPILETHIDTSTNDPQRLTYLPFIESRQTDFLYDKGRISNYKEVKTAQLELESKKLEAKMKLHEKELTELMVSTGIKSKEDAYKLYLRSRISEFDLDLETEKFTSTVDFIVDLMSKDDRVASWVATKFTDYTTLHKLAWVLYGVFGELAIDQLLRLVPSDSNKANPSSSDYRWTYRSKSDYDEGSFKNITPGLFYSTVMELGAVKDYIAEKYRVNSKHATDFKLLNSYYETYERNRGLVDRGDDSADLNEFLDEISKYLDTKKCRLPLIKELDDIPPSVELDPSEYLSKSVMHNLYQIKHKDKRIFCLRSQCGTGKNTVAGHPNYKLEGRIILAEPFKSVMEQAASEAWTNQDRGDQIFVNSSIESTLRSFKESDSESIRVNYETSLKNTNLSKNPDLVIHSTYNQVLNVSHEDLSTIDYVFIDEAHTLSDGLSYRSDVISKLMHHLIEFVAKKPKAKTKIIFMTGTPNVETHVIPELMEEYGVKHLYQRLIINKKYKVRPTVHLTHLDSLDSSERINCVINQINSYIKQGRKVCHIFNNKAKMDSYIREIQSRLSGNIKVGLFYSGSSGKCTRDILDGRFGEYDVVLTTTYFINGINIEKDGVEVGSNKPSNQKYGVVIDLGQGHTKVNAMDAVQAINRFRNRLCHATVFFPKIFKKNTQNKFDFNHSGKVLLGINKYNHHLLSKDSDPVEYQEESELPKDKIFLLKDVKKNPLSISMADINKASMDESRRTQVVDMISTKSRLYEDWFLSMDGYNYLMKDAGFLVIMKHHSSIIKSESMSRDHEELENSVIESFLNNDEALMYLSNQLDPDKRFTLRASGNTRDPLDSSVRNFKVSELINDRYVIEADFHSSHERSLNTLIRIHLSLCYWYGVEESISILRYLTNPDLNIIPLGGTHFLTLISKYYKSCKVVQMRSLNSPYAYIRSLDLMSTYEIGVTKVELDTSISYIISDPVVLDQIRSSWSDYQYDMISYKIRNSESGEKEALSTYFSDKALVSEYNLRDLEYQLDSFCTYQPMRLNKSGEVIEVEQIHIQKILYSSILAKPSLDSDIDRWQEPEKYNLIDLNSDIESFYDTLNDKFYAFRSQLDSDRSLNPLSEEFIQYEKFSPEFFRKLEEITTEYSKNKKISRYLNSQVSLFKDNLQLMYSIFKFSEYSTYKDLKVFKRIPYLDRLINLPEDFELGDIMPFHITSDTREKIAQLFLSNLNKEKLEELRGLEVKVWVALNTEGDPICVEKSKYDFSSSVCKYVYHNSEFLTTGGALPKEWNKGAYNPATFSRDYLHNMNENRRILNWEFMRLTLRVPKQI